MEAVNWYKEVPFSITVCDKEGVILEMNDKSAITFAKDGGRELIGKSLTGCHSPRDNRKIFDMISSESVNVYTIEKDGKKKLIYQCPWYRNGELGGLVELSLVIPFEIPHFMRGSRIIYHITSQDRWQEAQKEGVYLPEAYETDGFIHCSKKEQIPCVGERYYTGQAGLLILSINIDKLTSKLVYENLTGGEEVFPHIYGPLPLNAVEFTAAFEANTDGKFDFPEQWSPNKV